jgi:NAD(P)-dependent dehydrogenase (short-subunit alcohol dehydrogenase family)
LKGELHSSPGGTSGIGLATAKQFEGVVFLASNDSGYITGTELLVDGGFAQV